MTYQVRESVGFKIFDIVGMMIIGGFSIGGYGFILKYLVLESAMEYAIFAGISIAFWALIVYSLYHFLSSKILAVTVNERNRYFIIQRTLGAPETVYANEITAWYADVIPYLSKGGIKTDDCITISYGGRKVKIPYYFDNYARLVNSLKRLAGNQAQGAPIDESKLSPDSAIDYLVKQLDPAETYDFNITYVTDCAFIGFRPDHHRARPLLYRRNGRTLQESFFTYLCSRFDEWDEDLARQLREVNFNIRPVNGGFPEMISYESPKARKKKRDVQEHAEGLYYYLLQNLGEPVGMYENAEPLSQYARKLLGEELLHDEVEHLYFVVFDQYILCIVMAVDYD